MFLLWRRRRPVHETSKEFTVATPNTKTATETISDTLNENLNKTLNELPAFAQKFREQLVSTVQQSQQLSLDAAQTWVKAVSVLPVVDLPKIPGIPTMPNMEAATKYTFDVATDLLNAQRDFALQLTNALIPVKTA
jgi:hypothetical protein